MSARGYILLPVALALALIAAVAFVLNREAGVRVEVAAGESQADLARYVAEAGLEHARRRIQNDACTGYADLPETAFGEHSYRATVAPGSGSPVSITATGTLADGSERTLRAPEIRVYQPPRTETLELGPETGADTYVADGLDADENFGSAQTLRVSNDGGNERALLRFELAGLPPETRVSSALIELNFEGEGEGEDGDAAVHRVTRPWAESEATWNQAENDEPWSEPGGDYVDTPVASASLDLSDPGPVQWDVTGLVAGWVAGTVTNDGLLLDAGGEVEAARFTSSEATCNQPKLTVTYACECGQSCQLVPPGPPACSADYVPSAQTGEFSTALGMSDVWDLTYLPECKTFNTVTAPAGGAWLLVDYADDRIYMTDMAGGVLTSRATPTDHEFGIALIDSGERADELAVTDEADRRIYFLDLSGASQGFFSTNSFTKHPVGIGFIGTTATGTYDEHLVISSDKDNTGASNAGVYIVDQSGSLKASIDVSPYTPEPWGVAHIRETDKLLVAAKSGEVFVIDFSGTLLGQYDATTFGATEVQGIAVNPSTCAHVLNDKDNEKVIYLGP